MHPFTDHVAVVGVTVPLLRDNVAGAPTDAIDMADWDAVAFIVTVGVTDTTVDFKLTDCATSGGSYADISGKSITQLSGTDDNKVAIIVLKADELNSGARYVKGSLTAGDGTAGANTSVVALGYNPRKKPARSNDLAAVAEIVE